MTTDKKSIAREQVDVYPSDLPAPTFQEIIYGPHERNVLDFWQADSENPSPLVFVIHGGGWISGSKERIARFVEVVELLREGISVVAINYRLISEDIEETPPVKAPLEDAARALQYIRSRACEWKIDPQRIGVAGGSAGACSSLWLAYHSDIANTESSDPVLRESTALNCVAVRFPQTTLDPKLMVDWMPNSVYGAHAFGIESFDEFLQKRDSMLPWIKKYSPHSLVSSKSPPVALFYNGSPAMGESQNDPTHSANFGVGLQQRCLELGAECDLVYPGSTINHESPTKYLINKLNKSVSPSSHFSPF
jgi:acetyl esterase/lipase